GGRRSDVGGLEDPRNSEPGGDGRELAQLGAAGTARGDPASQRGHRDPASPAKLSCVSSLRSNSPTVASAAAAIAAGGPARAPAGRRAGAASNARRAAPPADAPHARRS